jgi:hypothetical protein
MTDTLADHIRDAQANLKAGIAIMQKRNPVGLDGIPIEFFNAMHALSYAAKAVELAAPATSCSYPSCVDQQTGSCTVTRYCPGPSGGGKTAPQAADAKASVRDSVDSTPSAPATAAMRHSTRGEAEEIG